MENVRKTKKGFPVQAVTKVMAMMALVVTFAACGNDGGDSNNNGVNVNGMYVDGCTNCGMITNPVSVGTLTSTSEYGNVTMSLQAFADQNQYQYYGSLNSYHGPLSLQGTMTVSSEWYEMGAGYGYGYGYGMGYGYGQVPNTGSIGTTPIMNNNTIYRNGYVGGGCRIPPGVYEIRTVSAAQGITGYGVISNMEVRTVNSNIRMAIVGAMIVGNKLKTFNGGGIHPITVNGVSCAQNFGAAFY